MSGFRHILCPVDFSERSKAIRPYVKAFVERFNAKLTLLNAVEIPPPETFGIDQSFPVMFDFPSLEPVLLESAQGLLRLDRSNPSGAIGRSGDRHRGLCARQPG